MKTPDEIKDNARTCISQPYTEPCGSCKLYPKCRGDVNYNLIALLDLVNEYERRLAQAEMERDAAVQTVHGLCLHCKNDRSEKCRKCLFWPYFVSTETYVDHWEWRGVFEENTAAIYIACVSEATPLFFKILVTCGFIAEEIWMTLTWVDGLGG